LASTFSLTGKLRMFSLMRRGTPQPFELLYILLRFSSEDQGRREGGCPNETASTT
jgi:hypothetical protein